MSVSLFISYAHKDDWAIADLRAALRPLEFDGLIDPWCDLRLSAGDDWNQEIATALDRAEIGILLLSIYFFESEYINRHELPKLLAARQRGLLAIPVVVSPIDLEQHARFEGIQMLNKPEKHLKQLKVWQRHKVWLSLTSQIRTHLTSVKIDPPLGAVNDSTLLLEGAFSNAAKNVGSSPPLRTLGGSGQSRSLFMVPPWRNQLFVGREAVMDRLTSYFSSRCSINSVVALTGPSGIGKTQTAIELTYRMRDELRQILWANAEDPTTLAKDFAEIAEALSLVPPTAPAPDIRVAVSDWLHRESSYLLILDNLDDTTWVHDFLPSKPGGHVLMISRLTSLDDLGVSFYERLGPLTLYESTELMLNNSGRTRLDTTEIDAARGISSRLDGLPLALQQAASYIREASCSFADYLAELERSILSILDTSKPKGGTSNQFAETWAMNFEPIRKQHPASSDLLLVASNLGPSQIPFEVFQCGSKHLGGALRSAVRSDEPTTVFTLLSPLQELSIVRIDSKNRTFDIHRLVQEATRSSLPQKVRDSWLIRTIRAVASAFPDAEFENWQQCERLIAHALVLWEMADEARLYRSETVDLLNRAGTYLYERSEFSLARQLSSRALAICQDRLQPNSSRTADALTLLGGICRIQGDLSTSQDLLQRSLGIRERILRRNSPQTAQSLNDLGLLLYYRKDYTTSKDLHRRALAIRESNFGPMGPKIAESLNNLGLVHFAEGDISEAAPFLRRALLIREVALGPDHPTTARTQNNLGRVLTAQGDFVGAGPLLEGALAVRERVLGQDHHDTAVSRLFLGEYLVAVGEVEKAVPLLQRALAVFDLKLLPGNENSTLTRSLLKSIRTQQGI